MTKDLDREDQIANLEKKVEELTRALGKKIVDKNKVAFEALADENKAKEEKKLRKELSKKTKEKIIDLYLQTKFERDYLQVRVNELEDKDWHEGLINQLENQADRLIKERDTYYLALKEAVDIMNIPDGICEDVECPDELACRECLMKRFIDYAKQKYDVETHSKEKCDG